MKKTLLAINREDFPEFRDLSLSLEEPEQAELVSLPRGGAGDPDEGRVHLGGTVMKDPVTGKFRMWYLAFPKFTGDLRFGSRVAYAESLDGIHWTKPDMGLVEYNGSFHNNLVSGLPGNSDVISVILDDDGLYKTPVMNVHALRPEMIENPVLRAEADAVPMPAFMGIASSRDGLRWNFTEKGIPAIMEKLEICRLFKCGGRYCMAGQQMRPWCDFPEYERVVVFYESEDLKNWRKMPAYYHSESGCQTHAAIAPLTRIGNLQLGLCGRFYEAPELPEQSFEVDLVLSAKPYCWHAPCKCRPYLRRGVAYAWNSGGILQSQGLVEHNGKMMFYFSGSSGGNSPFSAMTAGVASFTENRFGYAALKVGWDIGFRGIRQGDLRTRPITGVSPDDKLTVNCANFVEGGMLRCALTDEKGREMPGFTLDESMPITQEGIKVPTTWKNASALPETFCVKVAFFGKTFREQSPRLFAIEVKGKDKPK